MLFILFRYPAEIIQVDTSGRRFDRMSAARKSCQGHFAGTNDIEAIGEGEDTLVRRRSRSRRPRNKRRNTIAGTDQKEIEEVVNGYVFAFITPTSCLTTCQCRCLHENCVFLEFYFMFTYCKIIIISFYLIARMSFL